MGFISGCEGREIGAESLAEAGVANVCGKLKPRYSTDDSPLSPNFAPQKQA
jgi:hypothetical protein